MISHALLRIAGAGMIAIFLGCATTSSETTSVTTETASAQGPKKKRRNCREQVITGSRIRKKVCDGDANADNVGEVDKQTWGNEQKRVARPAIQR